jgi:hypothetical protein
MHSFSSKFEYEWLEANELRKPVKSNVVSPNIDTEG